MSEDEKEIKKLLVRLPKEMHDAARIKAIQENRPLSEVVRELLDEWLSRDKNKQGGNK